MSIKIHPYLLARLIAVQEAFGQPRRMAYAMAMNQGSTASTPTPKKAGNNWGAVIKDADEGEGGSGGRGTMRGHRGKNAVHAKAAMRKLTRNR